MNKDEFLSMNPDLRVKRINKMLETMQLPDIAKLLDMPSSTFSAEMQKGDYVYIKREKKYFKFLRDENSSKDELNTSDYNEELLFIKRNFDILKNIVSNQEMSNLLILDKKIYDSKAKYVNKNIKVNDSIYQEFTSTCERQFPHLKIQDLIAQAFVDFISKYSSMENKI
ncbi:hypothetical protein HNR63_002404 [Anoxybacillus kamchatkensis]|uniref:hypothetical protein n=1 Tax=Anoxybacillus ayderensis TaxID=265546 RepID=UPI0015EB552F|nr:hypothetical protein [Anoxybacillus ayderensis]MBA2879332.1 hypothetical protein [Anoxybacillus ayderensis]